MRSKSSYFKGIFCNRSELTRPSWLRPLWLKECKKVQNEMLYVHLVLWSYFNMN